MAWNEELGSGLTNATQNHFGCLVASYFIGDCLRNKSSATSLNRSYTLNETKQLLNSSYVENDFTEEQIVKFEQNLYGELFRDDPHQRLLLNQYRLPKAINTAAKNSNLKLSLTQLPLEMCVEINGLTIRVTQGVNKPTILLPEESLS